MSMPRSSEWEYFQPNERDNSIHGMERMLDDGSAIDVIAYGSYEAPGEFSWMIRLWDDEGGYSVRASYDDDVYYDDIEQAYDALCEVLEYDYPELVERDEIVRAPVKAKERFFAKLVTIGLAAALALPALGGCAGSDAYAANQYDMPLGTGTESVTYSQLITDDVFYDGYLACVDIMESGENPEIDGEGAGWYDGDFVFDDLDMDMLNYACFDNPMYSMYKTGLGDGIGITLNETTGNIRIKSEAISQGDDFDVMYAQVDRIAQDIADTAWEQADGSTAEYVKSVMEQITNSVFYAHDTSNTHCNDIYGALVNKSARCFGYASAVKYVLDLQGIPNFIATGSTSERHAWNMVKIDGTWLLVDATLSRSMMENAGASELCDCPVPWFYCLRTLDTVNHEARHPYTPEEETIALMNM